MSHTALYRKWRPADFDDVVDQQHIVQTLRHSVATGNIAHAYLFCGTRGTGKTSLAKIFAKAMNCLNPTEGNPCGVCEICTAITDGSLLDVVEIDAASNNSVDNIRRITDEVVFLPSAAKYKVYIIDEVHMLSIGAFNALLKTLEEPPAHAVFILATTEVHRIPATITSRCQRFDFRRIALSAITDRLKQVSDQEKIAIDEGGLQEIAVQADGALRDALSLLDQAQMAITGTITRSAVRQLIGVVDMTFIGNLALALTESDATAILKAVETLVMEGKDILRFTSDLANYYRNLMMIKAVADPTKLLVVTPDELEQLQQIAARYVQPEIVSIIKTLSKLLSDLKWITNQRTMLEVTLLSITGTRKKPTETASMTLAGSEETTLSAQLVQAVTTNAPSATTSAPIASTSAPSATTSAPIASTSLPHQEIRQATPEINEPISDSQTTPPATPAPPEKTATPAQDNKIPTDSSPHPENSPYPAGRPGFPDRDEYTDVLDMLAPGEDDLQGNQIEFPHPEEYGEPALFFPPEEKAMQTADDKRNNPEVPAAAEPPAGTETEGSLSGSSQLWQDTLKILEDNDAFVYMFAKNAYVSGDSQHIILSFTAQQESSYDFLSQQRGSRPLQEALEKANGGQPIQVNIRLESDNNERGTMDPAQSWVERIVQNANALGISIEVETEE